MYAESDSVERAFSEFQCVAVGVGGLVYGIKSQRSIKQHICRIFFLRVVYAVKNDRLFHSEWSDVSYSFHLYCVGHDADAAHDGEQQC